VNNAIEYENSVEYLMGLLLTRYSHSISEVSWTRRASGYVSSSFRSLLRPASPRSKMSECGTYFPSTGGTEVGQVPGHCCRVPLGGANCRQDGRQLGAQEAQPLPHRDAAFQQKGADLIGDAGALTDQSLAHAMQRLQIELIGGLRGDELHARALHRFGDRLRIAEVVLLPFEYGRTYFAGIRRASCPSICSLRLR
jgi:hypothetical protein